MDPTTIDDVMCDGGVRMVFQPLVDLETGRTLGYEALARGPEGTAFEQPMTMFAAAEAVGRRAELDWRCRATAMSVALDASLGNGCTLFINVEPDIGTAVVPPEHEAILAKAQHDLRIVLEVTERAVVE